MSKELKDFVRKEKIKKCNCLFLEPTKVDAVRVAPN